MAALWTRAALALGFVLAVEVGAEKLDPWDYRDMEIYIVSGDPSTCYQVNPGSRIAKGQAGIGASPDECKTNWKEDLDLGNFDGYNDDKLGAHHSGGSKEGCATWLKMNTDDSLTKIEGKVEEGEGDGCDTMITISGPPEAFQKAGAEGEQAQALFEVPGKSRPIASLRAAAPPAGGAGVSPSLGALAFPLMGMAAIGSGVALLAWRCRPQASEPAE